MYRCTRTVPKHIELEVLGLALSEKQIPQIVENNQSGTERMEPLEGTGVRPRQVRYQAALRPDITSFNSTATYNFAAGINRFHCTKTVPKSARLNDCGTANCDPGRPLALQALHEEDWKERRVQILQPRIRADFVKSRLARLTPVRDLAHCIAGRFALQ